MKLSPTVYTVNPIDAASTLVWVGFVARNGCELSGQGTQPGSGGVKGTQSFTESGFPGSKAPISTGDTLDRVVTM
jgi:hypothetical protein